MPTPQPNESSDDFMARCMAYPDMQKYPPDQRAAICHSKFEGKSEKAMNSLPPVHPNCVCSIENGKWNLGESKSGPCPICEMMAAQFNAEGNLSKSLKKMITLLHKSHETTPWMGYKRTLVKSTLQELLPAEKADISIITTDSVDADGDMLKADGMDFSDFIAIGSPVQYNHRSLQVGRAAWVKPYSKDGVTGWIAKTLYHSTDKGTEAYNLVKSGQLSGKSIGGDWLEAREPDAIEKSLGAKRIITKSKVYEFSVCVLGANPDAKVIAKEKAIVPKLTRDEIYKYLIANINIQDIVEIARGRI